MQHFIIEPNIPIPESKTGKSEFFYTLLQMKVGDSFLVKDRINFARAKTACSNFKKRKGLEFISRRVPEGLRIWRIK